MLKDRAAGKPIIVPDFVASDKCGEIDGYLYDMVIWQKDSRFLFFFQNFGLGGAAVDGLAGIGEPAFEAVIKAFDREGYAVLHAKAAKTLRYIQKLWMRQKKSVSYSITTNPRSLRRGRKDTLDETIYRLRS